MNKKSKIYSKLLLRAAKHYHTQQGYFDEQLIQPEHFFLASYPRSGNHYVRFTILSALHFQQTGKFPDDFSHFGKLPDIHRPDLDSATLYQPRVIKTHYPYDPRYRNIIHLIRDPRDVVVSYYHFTYGEASHYFNTPPAQPTLEEFVGHFLTGNVWPGTLRKHSQSYFDASKQAQVRYIQLHYETLVREPRKEFERLLIFLGITLSADDLTALIEHTSFENMTRLFKTDSARKGAGFTKKESITRKGGSGGYVDELSKESIARLQQSFGGYQPKSE